MGRQPIAGLTHIDNIYSHLRPINSPDKRVFELREQTGVPRDNSHMHRENMQTPHRKAGAEIRTLNLLATYLPLF